MLTLRREIK
jgi:hypothetical protein